MVALIIVHHAYKCDIIKLKIYFFNDYCDGDCVFYILFTDSKGACQYVDDKICASWSLN